MRALTAFSFLAIATLTGCQAEPPLGSPAAEADNHRPPMEIPTPESAVPRSTDAGNQTPTEGISPTP